MTIARALPMGEAVVAALPKRSGSRRRVGMRLLWEYVADRDVMVLQRDMLVGLLQVAIGLRLRRG